MGHSGSASGIRVCKCSARDTLLKSPQAGYHSLDLHGAKHLGCDCDRILCEHCSFIERQKREEQ